MAQTPNTPQKGSEAFLKKLIHSSWFLPGAAIVVMLAFLMASFFTQPSRQVDTNVGLQLLNDHQVKSAKIYDGDQRVELQLKDDYKKGNDNYGKSVRFYYVQPRGDEVAKAMESAELESYTDQPVEHSFLGSLVSLLLPILIFGALFWFLMGRVGGGSSVMSFSKSRAKKFTKDKPDVRFSDVAGVDEALAELEEVREFLAEPEKFTRLGAKIPKGVLLYGPPGTGKTLLAKAVAGEAGVPFYSISGSDFVEMFVGVGASRVRDLFKEAKSDPAAIVFVDEIDAVGRRRGVGMGGGNDEREQTLNQLLAEMDGFDGKKGVVILAATNRPDSLDPALLRPGRFDRRVPVELPDLKGREEILKVHAKNIRVGDNVDYNAIARMASGASGAELANMINEAALRAVRDGRKFVTQADLEESVEVVIAGYQKKNKIMTDKEKLIVSYHEVGHALVAALQSHSAPVTKITIIPRTSGALGYTMQVDEDEHNLMSREELENKIATLTGGRVAEDLVFHSITTGASNDIEQATKVARAMITRFGMNEEFGMVAFETVTNQYLGGDTSLACSESTAAQIDEKVVAAVRKQYDKAEQLLKDNMPKLHELAKYLYEKETITGDEFMEILNLSPDQLTTTRMETN